MCIDSLVSLQTEGTPYEIEIWLFRSNHEAMMLINRY